MWIIHKMLSKFYSSSIFGPFFFLLHLLQIHEILIFGCEKGWSYDIQKLGLILTSKIVIFIVNIACQIMDLN